LPVRDYALNGEPHTADRTKEDILFAERWSRNFGPVVKLEHLRKDERYVDTQTLFG